MAENSRLAVGAFRRGQIASMRASGISSIVDAPSPPRKFPVPLVGSLIHWFAYNASGASELQNLFKENVASALHHTYYSGSLTDYLLKDKVCALPDS